MNKSRKGRTKREEVEHGKKVFEPGAVKIPDQFSNCIIQPINSFLDFRGNESKEMLSTGQLLVKVDKYAVVPLEHYKLLVKLAERGVRRHGLTPEHRAALQQQRGSSPGLGLPQVSALPSALRKPK